MSNRGLGRLGVICLVVGVLVLAVGFGAQLAMVMAMILFWALILVSTSAATGGTVAPATMSFDVPDVLPAAVATSGALFAAAAACLGVLVRRRVARRGGA